MRYSGGVGRSSYFRARKSRQTEHDADPIGVGVAARTRVATPQSSQAGDARTELADQDAGGLIASARGSAMSAAGAARRPVRPGRDRPVAGEGPLRAGAILGGADPWRGGGHHQPGDRECGVAVDCGGAGHQPGGTEPGRRGVHLGVGLVDAVFGCAGRRLRSQAGHDGGRRLGGSPAREKEAI